MKKPILIVLALLFIYVPTLAYGKLIKGVRISYTVASSSTKIESQDFSVCNRGAADMMINCDATATLTAHIVVGDCISSGKLSHMCTNLHIIGDGNGTADVIMWDHE